MRKRNDRVTNKSLTENDNPHKSSPLMTGEPSSSCARRGWNLLLETLAFDTRSIALFRVILAGVVLWDVCYEYMPDAWWFLHDSGCVHVLAWAVALDHGWSFMHSPNSWTMNESQSPLTDVEGLCMHCI